MSFKDGALEFGKDLLGGAATLAAGALGGPLVGGAAGLAIDWLTGNDENPANPVANAADQGFDALRDRYATQQQGQGVATAPGGNAGLQPMPGGGLQGPVYSTQSAGALMPYVRQTIDLFLKYPGLGKIVQRFWDFPQNEPVKNHVNRRAWAQMSKQLPEYMREALEQFLVGFPAPIGLSSAAEDAFLLLTIAEAGYEPETYGLCKYSD